MCNFSRCIVYFKVSGFWWTIRKGQIIMIEVIFGHQKFNESYLFIWFECYDSVCILSKTFSFQSKTISRKPFQSQKLYWINFILSSIRRLVNSQISTFTNKFLIFLGEFTYFISFVPISFILQIWKMKPIQFSQFF